MSFLRSSHFSVFDLKIYTHTHTYIMYLCIHVFCLELFKTEKFEFRGFQIKSSMELGLHLAFFATKGTFHLPSSYTCMHVKNTKIPMPSKISSKFKMLYISNHWSDSKFILRDTHTKIVKSVQSDHVVLICILSIVVKKYAKC